MKLLKGAWRVLVGVKDALALLFLLVFFGGTFALLSATPNAGETRGGALLLDLNGALVEQAEAVDPLSMIAGNGAAFAQFQTRDLVHALRTAATDDGIKTVVLNLDGFVGGGQVALQDVAAAIDQVRAAKKPVLAYATAYADDGYLLAAHASEIWLNPMGDVMLFGPGGTQPYFKGLLDKFGVNIKVYRVGKFKSFVEPYTSAQQSGEAKAANQALADALWSDWQADVKKARPQADLAPILTDPATAANGRDYSQSVLALKLVDKLGDDNDFGRRVAAITGSDDSRGAGDFNHTDLAAYLAANPDDGGSDSVGIVTVAGSIVDGEAPAGTAGGATISRLIERAATDDDIKALVVRVDSPGGSALASEKIRRAMQMVRDAKKPVVVSMANVAASGGYWIAAGGDRIFAEPATVTGSIGVFGLFPTFETTLARYGVTTDGVRTTPFSGQPDILGGTTPEFDTAMQTGIDQIYRRFVTLVSASRKLPPARVEEIAQGRVWDGGTARQLGLTDAFGSLDDAVAEAARRAKIAPDDVRRVWIEDQPGLLAWLFAGAQATMSNSGTDPIGRMALRREMAMVAAWREARAIVEGPSAQVRCLECPPSPALLRRNTTMNIVLDRIFG